MDGQVEFDVGRDFIAALRQLEELGSQLFIMASLGQMAKPIGLLMQISCPLSHGNDAT